MFAVWAVLGLLEVLVIELQTGLRGSLWTAGKFCPGRGKESVN